MLPATLAAARVLAGAWPCAAADGEHRPARTALRAEACFAPGTPPEMVEEIGRRLQGSQLSLAAPADGYQFSDADRWTATATDGGGLAQGEPTTLTWSYVPDGTSVCGYIGEASAGSNLRSWLNGLYGNFAGWHAVFQQMFDRWGALTGTRYVYEPNDDGAAFSCLTLPGGQLGVRGDIRIAAHVIDGNFGVLAYNFFPDAGDMVIDSNDAFYADKASSSLKLRNVLAHEHGHGLGLAHVCPVNRTKLMEPFASTAFDGPQPDDILAVNRGYGDDLEDDDSAAAAMPLGALPSAASVELDPLSIDDNRDVDFVSFDVTEPVRITVAATPTGSTYLSGPQNSDGSCSGGSNYDSLRIHDLGLALLGGDGSTVLAAASATSPGSAETIADFALANPGTYFVRVNGSAANSAQLYALSLSTQSLRAPSLALTGQVSPPLDPHPVGSELSYLLTVSNSGSGTASGVVVRACLDRAFDPLQVTVLDGGVWNQPPAPSGCTGDWISWTLPSPIGPDASATVGFRAVIPLDTADGATLINTAEVVSSQTAAVASAPISASACAPGLVLAMTASRSAYAEGETVTWTFTASNPHASCSSTAIALTDDIDLARVEDQPALTWSTPAGASSAWSGGRLTWTLPALAPGAATVITVSSRIRAGTSGSMLCNQGGGTWAESASPATSSAACSEIAAGCPVSGVPAVPGLTLSKGPGPGEVTLSWTAVNLAQEYDLWRIADDKSVIGSAGRGSPAPVSAVTGCADPAPATGTSCTDRGARVAEGIDYYQARGVCGGAEGAL